MAKYVRKCKGIGEVAAMEVAQLGVRTRARARALAMAAANSGTAKRRKVCGRESELSSSVVQVKSRRRVVDMPENSVSPANSSDPCASPSSDQIPASCCSSNGSAEAAKDWFKFVDLEDESTQIEASTCNFDCRERRENTPSSELRAEPGELESTARPPEANSRHRSTAEKVPSEAELEEFFTAAEKDLQKRFTERYNYDIVKDVPLEGRYEWVRQKR